MRELRPGLNTAAIVIHQADPERQQETGQSVVAMSRCGPSGKEGSEELDLGNAGQSRECE